MSLQANVLQRFMDVYPQSTFKFISEKTGIQMTRVFRLLNGAEMKMKEYEIFNQVLFDKRDVSLEETLQQCLKNLPQDCLEELSHLMNRKLQLSILKRESLTPLAESAIA